MLSFVKFIRPSSLSLHHIRFHDSTCFKEILGQVLFLVVTGYQGRMCGTRMVCMSSLRQWLCADVKQLVLAAQSIANIVKSSLGPLGLDKMLVDNIGVRNHL